jgi:hypothetical protein
MAPNSEALGAEFSLIRKADSSSGLDTWKPKKSWYHWGA